MSIRIKAFIDIILFFLMIAIVVYFIQHYVIYSSFLKIENNETTENIRRVIKTTEREIYHLDNLCNDWAQWTDSYDFMDSLSEDYIEGNLLYETFENNDINLIFYFRNDGAVFWGEAYDLEKKEPVVVDFLNVDRLDASHPLITFPLSNAEEHDKMKSGVIDTSHGPMIFVTRPILRSDGSGPAKGMLTMGRFINKRILDSLRDQTRIDFEIEYPLTEEKIRSIRESKATYVEKDFIFYTLDHDNYTDVRTIYSDVYGDPVFSIYYRFPREITKQGMASLWNALLMFVAAGLIITYIINLRLQHNFIKPLQRLTDHALRFENEEDYSIRLNLDRKDEIGALAKSIDMMMQTISERTKDLKAANEKLTELSQIDGLTGIANRRMFDDFISKEWRRMIREKGTMSLILADVDYFKKYNDIYGHQMGDKCLVLVAGSIKGSIHRPDDMGARYGGEEFAVILPDTEENGAFFIAEKIRKAVSELNIEHKGSGAYSTVTMSLGVCSIIPQKGDELNDFIRNADHALYFAKETGRNRTVIFGKFPEILPNRK